VSVAPEETAAAEERPVGRARADSSLNARAFMLSNVFDKLDLDKSGTMDWEEFAALNRRVSGDDWDPAAAREEFDEIDEDFSGFVDKEEWVSYFIKYCSAESDESFRALVGSFVLVTEA